MVSLYYNMFSSQNLMGDLHVDVLADGTWNNDLIHITGNQGTDWKPAQASLDAYIGKTVQIRFRGVTGQSYTSDICIDDISINASGVGILPTGSRGQVFGLSLREGILNLRMEPSVRAEVRVLDLHGRSIFRFVKERGVASMQKPVPLPSGFYIVNIKDELDHIVNHGFVVTH